MQIKIFTVPILEGEGIIEEMNTFLRSKKVLKVDSELVATDEGSFWSFCLRYLEQTPESKNKKVDYKEALDQETFKRFSELRQIRRQLAQDEGIPAYAIFTNEELATMAKQESLTLASLRKVKGIGAKKLEKYGHHFVASKNNEASK